MGAESGVKLSTLELITHRVLDLSLRYGPEFALAGTGIPDNVAWQISIGLPDVMYSQDDDLYFSPIAVELAAYREKDTQENKKPLFIVRGAMMGVFKFTKDDATESARREELILHQTPALLLPILRGVISGTIAIAGYGPQTVPLMNMVSLSKNSERKIVPMGEAGAFSVKSNDETMK